MKAFNDKTINNNIVDKIDENWRFWEFAINKEDSKLDRLLSDLYQEILNEETCMKCSNCCEIFMPVITREEIFNISDVLKIDFEKFKKYFLEEVDEGFAINKSPCHFLKNGCCSIYNNRPLTCRNYPINVEDEFSAKLINLIHAYEKCPVALKIVEILKSYYIGEF